jgi:MinD-like ATPase involved in chromosome partitioning or flagellar assembly
MAMTPDIAIAASARDWPDRLHRFLLDHGGGRVVDRIMSADQATGQTFDVLLIDDVCSFLTPMLVTILKQSSREVIGVYLPEDGSDAKRRLLECGISDVIESGASGEEFLSKVTATLAHRVDASAIETSTSSSGLRLAVTGPCAGVGITEVSIALASLLARRSETMLVDMDPVWPSVAQRLDLPLHPNIRTALDHALHRVDRLEDAIHLVHRLSVIGGRADGGAGADIPRSDYSMLLNVLGTRYQVVVADLGPLTEANRAVLRDFDTLILVAAPNPVGITRLIRTLQLVENVAPGLSCLAVVNRCAAGFKRSELVDEVRRVVPDAAVASLPQEPRLEEAAWNGSLVSRGRFNKAVEDMAGVVVRSLP